MCQLTRPTQLSFLTNAIQKLEMLHHFLTFLAFFLGDAFALFSFPLEVALDPFTLADEDLMFLGQLDQYSKFAMQE